MFKPLKDLGRRFLKHRGYDIYYWHVSFSAKARLEAVLAYLKPDCILDVGASDGSFAKEVRELGYRGRIISFEPLDKWHEKLCSAAHYDPLWHVRKTALGDHSGSINLNVSDNLYFSSTLPIEESTVATLPSAGYTESREVPLCRIDDLSLEAQRVFIKVDVQGAERAVLDGANHVMGRTVGILIELSSERIYKGQSLDLEMIEYLRERNFSLWNWETVFADQHGRTLQYDATFIHHNVLNQS